MSPNWGNNIPESPARPTPPSAEAAIEDARRVLSLVDKRHDKMLRRIHASRRIGL
jgi:phage regulator Rha-like protein